MSSNDNSAAACPVDHKTRQAWLDQARANAPTPTASPPSPVQTSPDPAPAALLPSPPLGTSRQVSTIPRATADLPNLPSPSQPANNETETGSDKRTGNWIYPSEQMFFDAMRRKSHSPHAPDMKAIVPIHNAVNERAWQHIKQWEAGRGSQVCGGPRLVSFSGLSTSMTPRARWNSFVGYQAPFDRHDWVVDRCGQRIEYVIDFYAGKSTGRNEELNFYLDVRPKLNSWEGWKMRMAKFWGW